MQASWSFTAFLNRNLLSLSSIGLIHALHIDYDYHSFFISSYTSSLLLLAVLLLLIHQGHLRLNNYHHSLV